MADDTLDMGYGNHMAFMFVFWPGFVGIVVEL